jgi:DnaJ family protein C protein 11
LALSIFQIQLLLGPESSIAVGWQKKEEKMSASGELKVHLITFSTRQNINDKKVHKTLGNSLK